MHTLVVDNVYFDKNGFVLKHNVANGALMYNYFKNGEWRGDRRLIEEDQSLIYRGVRIPANSNFNDYGSIGIYYVLNQADADTMTNIPDKRSGKLIVMSLTELSSWNMQIYVTNNADGIYRRRQANAGVWQPWVRVANDRDSSSLMTATGKNLLPSWSYISSSYTTNGITFTFNPATGEITVNGTATDLAHCVLAGSTMNPYDLPEGEYILSGCPSGGSVSSYMLKLQAASSPNSSILNFDDYGNSVRFALNEHASSYPNLGTNYYIRIAKGYTANNLVFKPMLRPAFSSDTYIPNDSFHKGNLYIGYCETAGNVKDKVATVDGYFKLRKGVTVCVKFKNSNSYSATSENKVTLNVNGTGAYNIYFNNGNPTGTNRTAFGSSNRFVTYVFDGGSWVWQSHGSDDNTTYTPQSLGFGYGTCSTASSTLEKAVSLSGYNLVNGGYVSVRFTNAVNRNSTMNINSRGAKPIYYNNSAIGNNIILAGCTALFVYDGTRYHLLSTDYASTSQMNYVQRDQVVWSSVLGNNYNTDSWSCNIQRQGRILIGSFEIATNQGANTITFPSYNGGNNKVFVHFPLGIDIAGYYECIVTVGATTYPAFISTDSTLLFCRKITLAFQRD